MILIDRASTPHALNLCISIDLKFCSFPIAIDIYHFLLLYSEDVAEAYKHRAREQFPLSVHFA
jgi:hypothetical protein